MDMIDPRFEPDAQAFEIMAARAVASLPDIFQTHLKDVVFRVEDFADRETLDALNIANPWNLSGLYRGRPVSAQSIWSSHDLPPMIFLYRKPLIAEWMAKRLDLQELVTHVIVHEIAHHFGYSDEEIHAVEESGGE